METYIRPLMSSLRNLDLSSGNQEGFSRNNDLGGIYASHYSCFSPKPQCFDQGNSVPRPQLVDRAPRGSPSHGGPPYAPVPSAPRSFVDTHDGMRINVGPRYSRMNEAHRVPGMFRPVDASPAYSPSYIGCSPMNQNGYFGQGFIRPSPRSNGQNGYFGQGFIHPGPRSNGQNGYFGQGFIHPIPRSNGQNGYFGQGFIHPSPRSNGQNGYHNQEFTETRGNGRNRYGNQEFTERTNPQGIVSMAMRNEQLMFIQHAVMVELVRCMRILNEILWRSLPQLEAKMAVPMDDQQTPNRTSGSAQGSPGPTIATRIFVGGLASTVTESDFKTYFDQFGTITNSEVKYDEFTQRARGFGFITFDSEKAVDKVLLRTSFHELNGKMVEVKRAIPKDVYRKSIRGQLGGLNYGLRKVSSLLGAYTQAYSPSQVGGSGNAAFDFAE